MANFPTSISTDALLYIAVNSLQTTLAIAVSNSDTTLTLTSTSGFPTTGMVTLDNNEVASYTGISGADLTGVTRGADGTTAFSHGIGVTVGLTVVAAHHNRLKDEVIAVETALGSGFAKGNLSSTVGTDGITVTGGTGAVIGSGTSISQQAATNSVPGYLTAADHTTFASATPNALPLAGGTMTGDITMDNDKAVIFKETTANGTDAVTVKAPASVTTSYTIQLPPAVATSGQVLTDAAGNGVLSWASPGSGTVTNVSGTANQISVATGTTTPVISMSSAIILPGTLTAGGDINMANFSITNFSLTSYRRPVLQYVSTTTVQIEAGVDGTSNEVMIVFPDGTVRKDSTTLHTLLTISRVAALSGTKQSGVRTGTVANNTWYAIYAVKATDNATDFVAVADTVIPIQANFTTLNTNFGTSGWVYLGIIRCGDGQAATANIQNFVQAGNQTSVTGRNVSTSGPNTAGIIMTNTASAASITYTYDAGTTSSQIPNNICLVDWTVDGAANGNSGMKATAQADTLLNLYTQPATGSGTNIGIITNRNPVDGIVCLTIGANQAMDILISRWVDGVLGIGSNPLL